MWKQSISCDGLEEHVWFSVVGPELDAGTKKQGSWQLLIKSCPLWASCCQNYVLTPWTCCSPGWGQSSIVIHGMALIHLHIFLQSEVLISTFSQVTSLILFKNQAPFFLLLWRIHYLGKNSTSWNILHSSANSIKAPFVASLVRRLFRRSEAQASGILCMWEAQQLSKPLSISLMCMWLWWPRAASARPLNRQQRMCQEQKAHSISKRLLWLLQCARYFGNYVVIATQSRQHYSSLRSPSARVQYKESWTEAEVFTLCTELYPLRLKGGHRFLELCDLHAGCWISLITVKQKVPLLMNVLTLLKTQSQSLL